MAQAASFLQYVQDWIAGRAPAPPIVALLGIRLLESRDGTGVAELAADERHHNAMGGVHGGVLCDLADVAMGAAVVSVLKPDEMFASISLGIEFLRPCRQALLTARAGLLRQGSNVVFCVCRIDDDAGRHVAQISSTVLLQRRADSSKNTHGS